MDSFGQFWHTPFSCSHLLLTFITVSLNVFNSSAIILLSKRQSFLIRVLSLSTYLLVSIVTGRPNRSSSTSSLPSKHLLCHSNTRSLGKMFSSYASRNILIISVAVFFSFTRNLMLTCCSILLSSMIAES